MVGKIAQATRREVVASVLRNAIVSGEYAPGAVLREVELANRMGVSPTPVREAFGELAAEGLIEIRAHRQKRVSAIDLASMRDLLRVQTELWRLGYAWGLPNIGASEIDDLRIALDAYRAGLSTDDILRTIQASHGFHTVILRASNNSELLRSTLDRRALIARFVLLHGRSTVNARGLSEHEKILAAIERKDHEAALATMNRVANRMLALTGRDSTFSSQ